MKRKYKQFKDWLPFMVHFGKYFWKLCGDKPDGQWHEVTFYMKQNKIPKTKLRTTRPAPTTKEERES
jgi:hypothetical protein